MIHVCKIFLSPSLSLFPLLLCPSLLILYSSPGFSHAGMTAEGDNSVLMQKVAKELLAGVQAGKIKLPVVSDAGSAASWDLNKPETHLKLFRLREQLLLKTVGAFCVTILGFMTHNLLFRLCDIIITLTCLFSPIVAWRLPFSQSEERRSV